MAENKEHLTPLAHSAQNRCFGCGQANPAGLHLEFQLAEDGSVVCHATVADTFEGPRGYLHGGIVATLLDEAMSKAVRAKGFTAMTRHIEVDYLRPTPSGAAIRIEGRTVQSDGRKHRTEARIVDAGGATLAQAKGLFIEVKPREAGAKQSEDRPAED
ncbi:MAG: PaaI family thioesterase [Terracidiphilus sp.]